jgi:hypothetical protein
MVAAHGAVRNAATGSWHYIRLVWRALAVQVLRTVLVLA